jgi:hypothetical protein
MIIATVILTYIILKLMLNKDLYIKSASYNLQILSIDQLISLPQHFKQI